MLVEFKIANFKCFRDEVTLSLVPAGQDRALCGNIWKGNRPRVLKSAALFGANASGKTSLLDGLYVLREFVARSTTEMTIGDPIPGVEPFRLSPETRDRPSAFEILVELDGVGFRYGVELTRDRVHREGLQRQDAADGSKWLPLIERDAVRQEQPRIVLHEQLGSQARRKQIIQDTRTNALVLSRAAERNVEPILPLFRWFKDRICHSTPGAGSPPDFVLLHSLAATAKKDDEYLTRLAAFVRDADTGIVGLRTEAIAADQMLPPEFKTEDDAPAELREAVTHIREFIRLVEELSKKDERISASRFQFYTEHAGSEEKPVRFDLTNESAGTLRYLLIAARLLTHCQSGDLVVVDELDSSLHPELARRIVQVAHSPEFGRSGAQLIFSAQDVTLMDPALMRRDQIVFTQKSARGASELYSLWDFERMPRKSAAWAKNYLAGRFGGVPVFGPLLADIPQSDEPTGVETSSLQPAEAD